jgi:hypothetical protein
MRSILISSLTLSDAIFRTFTPVIVKNKIPITQDDPPQRFESMVVSGRHVRYIHFPNEIDVCKTIDNQVSTLASCSLTQL